MEDDPANKKYEQVDSIKEFIPKEKEFFYKNGNIIAEKYTRHNQYVEDLFYISQYIYNDKKQLISIIRIWLMKTTKNRITRFLRPLIRASSSMGK